MRTKIKSNKEKDISSFVFRFHDIMHEVLKIERHNMHFGTDVELSRAEIHLVEAIEENKGSHVTKLAEILDVTKGAISQLLAKLQNKGIILKKEDQNNRSRMIISLTKKGKIAYEEHEKFHEKFDRVFMKMFDGYSEREVKMLLEFSEKARDILEEFNVVK